MQHMQKLLLVPERGTRDGGETLGIGKNLLIQSRCNPRATDGLYYFFQEKIQSSKAKLVLSF